MDQFLLLRRFQRGIACPWEGSGSGFSSGSRQTDREMPDYDIRYIDEKIIVIITKKNNYGLVQDLNPGPPAL